MSAEIHSYVFGPVDGVPAAVAPFSQATLCDGRLYVTGQMPIDPATDALVPGGIAEQTDQVMRNLETVVRLCGSTLDRTVQAGAYLTQFERDYPAFNTAYAKWFPERLPSRTCIGVTALAVGALVEVDLVVVP
ncbi:MAG: RidA family protein [Solirubrobacteraceae bacterium]|nr:RidA family protein [Solirubrobacteraceae bacterium]